VAVAVLAMLASPAAAQVNTATIEVLTFDQQNLAMPGVTVQARNVDTGVTRVDVADANGRAVFSALPPGTYAVSANLESFAPITDQPVVVRIGQTARLEFTMQAQMSETIVVTAEVPVVDVLKTDSSTNIVPEQIQSLPVPDREFEKLAFITPTVQRERGGFRFIQNAPVVGASGNASQNSILVDGAEFTDQALGLSRARFSQDAIQEFRVIASRFDTEIGGSQGGALSVITKSGSNEHHGSVFGFWRDASLRETGALEEENDDYNRQQYGATIGGPIVRDKTHYFLSYEHIDVTDIAPFRPGGAFAPLATNYDFPTTQDLALLSLNHQFSASASGFLKGVYEKFRQENFRVGGINDISNGQQLNRDNWNVVLGLTNVFGDGSMLNEARFQIGDRDYDEPTNSNDVEEWFSGGNTLRIGANVVGDLLGYGSYWELRDTFHIQTGSGRSTHDWKLGGSWFHVEERSDIPTFQEGLFVYADDTRAFPLTYIYGEGSADVTVETDILSAFIQDDWRMAPNFTLSLGLRYDYDTDGNNPDFTHPLVGPRSVDENNFQPRVGFSWDLGNNGKSVLRGGIGLFHGRYLLVPNFTEEQQNGVTGRITRTNLNGWVICLQLGIPLDQCPFPPINPADPENSGVELGRDISLLEDNLRAPQTTQVSLGFTRRLGNTGLYFDIEGLYAEGYNEIFIRDKNFGGNDNPVRPNSDYNQINTYTNDGHSEYKAVIASLNGTFGRGHLLTSSITWMDKKNLSDDFSPVFPTGYPSDPANPEGEWGYSRGHEDYRAVVSGVFRLPLNFYLGATWQYGSGQPWNRILGYDANGDGKNSDRAEGVDRNDQDGPTFNSFALRLGWIISLGGSAELELIAEAFNLFDTVNYDVTSINNAEFLAAGVPNPDFGEYRATLDPREIQLGARFRF
jgi:hypothetical protein